MSQLSSRVPCGTPASWLTIPIPAHSRLVPHPAKTFQTADLWSKPNLRTAAVIYVALKHPVLKSHVTYLLPPSQLLSGKLTEHEVGFNSSV